jgi:hypothetical protein
VVLICAATYFFYHLYKQLFMGAVFVVYVRRSLRKEFGVAPNLAFDCDGFNGLRPLRYFIMWTWGSTVADFFLTLAVLVVWLPFGLFTVYVEVVLTLLDIFFALYPVALAVGGIILERKRFVQDIQRSPTLSDEKKATRIAGVWATSPLPFRLRSVFSVLVIYLILPAVLAVLSAVLKS